MRPSLPVGTILQNRYRVLSILGQGGFGRTYLAEDQGRFNERCALKELTPAQGGDYALDKSKELFQREAQILYQIQHPQIPQFRATFEQDQRLFLVQDYVEGQTYRALLDQRRAQGLAFSEGEALQFMRQLLPVMAHIHSKGVIHRDIAPDNVILRQQDSKPVLIDFGVVKELATRFQTMTTGVVQPTTVGKPGYAPIEQMQTGKAYPSSDLYSLAVTAVVLLTGREPQELFDDSTMTWYWQRWVTVNPGFAQVLNRMLSYRPGDRYQSVSEVVQALQTAFNPVAPVQQPSVQMPVQPPPKAVYPPEAPVSAQPPPQPAQSHMQTMAVGQRQQPEAIPDPRSQPTIEEPGSSLWDDPLAIIALGIGLVVLTGLGSWLIMQTILSNQDSSNSLPPPIVTPTVTPTPTPTPTVTPTPTPTSTPQPPDPVNSTERLTIDPDTTVTRRGVLRSNETKTYIVSGSQNQILETDISGDGILMSIIGPDGVPVDRNARRVSYWQGSLPFNGDYLLQLSPVQGVNNGRYDLNITLRSAARPTPPSPSPPLPSPSPVEPIINETPVQLEFPPGDPSQSFVGSIERDAINRYVVSARQGTELAARVNKGTLRVRNSAGELVSRGDTRWKTNIDDGGRYLIDVLGTEGTQYTLDLRIR